jgi:hypothetical protein
MQPTDDDKRVEQQESIINSTHNEGKEIDFLKVSLENKLTAIMEETNLIRLDLIRHMLIKERYQPIPLYDWRYSITSMKRILSPESDERDNNCIVRNRSIMDIISLLIDQCHTYEQFIQRIEKTMILQLVNQCIASSFYHKILTAQQMEFTDKLGYYYTLNIENNESLLLFVQVGKYSNEKNRSSEQIYTQLFSSINCMHIHYMRYMWLNINSGFVEYEIWSIPQTDSMQIVNYDVWRSRLPKAPSYLVNDIQPIFSKVLTQRTMWRGIRLHYKFECLLRNPSERNSDAFCNEVLTLCERELSIEFLNVAELCFYLQSRVALRESDDIPCVFTGFIDAFAYSLKTKQLVIIDWKTYDQDINKWMEYKFQLYIYCRAMKILLNLEYTPQAYLCFLKMDKDQRSSNASILKMYDTHSDESYFDQIVQSMNLQTILKPFLFSAKSNESESNEIDGITQKLQDTKIVTNKCVAPARTLSQIFRQELFPSVNKYRKVLPILVRTSADIDEDTTIFPECCPVFIFGLCLNLEDQPILLKTINIKKTVTIVGCMYFVSMKLDGDGTIEILKGGELILANCSVNVAINIDDEGSVRYDNNTVFNCKLTTQPLSTFSQIEE